LIASATFCAIRSTSMPISANICSAVTRLSSMTYLSSKIIKNIETFSNVSHYKTCSYVAPVKNLTHVTYLAFSPEKTGRENKFITAVLPLGSGDKEPAVQIERLKANDAIGARLIEGEMITDVYLNLRADGRKMHRNSCNIIDGWDTDAYMFAVTRPKEADTNDPDSVVRYFVACGSYLRRDGKVVLDSLSKFYTVFMPIE
jgi:hypothetical protein